MVISAILIEFGLLKVHEIEGFFLKQIFGKFRFGRVKWEILDNRRLDDGDSVVLLILILEPRRWDNGDPVVLLIIILEPRRLDNGYSVVLSEFILELRTVWININKKKMNKNWNIDINININNANTALLRNNVKRVVTSWEASSPATFL